MRLSHVSTLTKENRANSEIIHEQPIQIQLDIPTQFPTSIRATQLEFTKYQEIDFAGTSKKQNIARHFDGKNVKHPIILGQKRIG